MPYKLPLLNKRKTYDLYVNNQKYLNFEFKKDAENMIKERNLYSSKIKSRTSNPYSLGDMWRDDFDYVGMVKYGSEADSSWGIEKLQKLFDSYEDVNYHQESEYLFSAIESLKEGDKEKADNELLKFRKINKELLLKWEKQ